MAARKLVFGSTVGGILCLCLVSTARSQKPYVTTPHPVRLLSANDGANVIRFEEKGVEKSRKIDDSITVIDLGPDGPPIVRTVYGEVPNAICGSPHMAISSDGRLGFVTNHAWRFDDRVDEYADFSKLPADRRNILSVIDLESPTLKVIQRIDLPHLSYMVLAHPNGQQFVVNSGREFQVFHCDGTKLTSTGTYAIPVHIVSFAISPRGDRIIATGYKKRLTIDIPLDELDMRIHRFSMDETGIKHLHEVAIAENVDARIDNPFSPRFSPDAKRVLVMPGQRASSFHPTGPSYLSGARWSIT